eukprot:TRINITY_DN4821_c0_g1_i1.p4 TRINITY_DN4821_c0_g1~~TRINITY_DN4821_c0_g1_i1.p4  ORF type:complete len:105 (-),score=29.70 TRINITY_DN4821_c0_g1_i1:196-510(-)
MTLAQPSPFRGAILATAALSALVSLVAILIGLVPRLGQVVRAKLSKLNSRSMEEKRRKLVDALAEIADRLLDQLIACNAIIGTVVVLIAILLLAVSIILIWIAQ